MEKIFIKMFGEFSITYSRKTLSDKNVKGYKLWDLIRYMVINKNREISQDELIETFWSEQRNPANALKTLVCRARKELTKAFGCDIGLIESCGSSYRLSGDAHIVTDATVMTELLRKADNEDTDINDRLKFYHDALDLYKGEFMCNCDRVWAIAPRVYFNTYVFDCADRYIKLMQKKSMWSEIVRVCEKMTTIIDTDEKIYKHLISALFRMKNYEQARYEYENYKGLLLTRVGAFPSKELTELYESVMKPASDSRSSLDFVLSELQTGSGNARGGHYCEFDVFSHFFELCKNECKRNNTPLYITLITVTTEAGEIIQDEKFLEKAMKKLLQLIKSTTIPTDIYTRYSISQFVVLIAGHKNDIKEKLISKAAPYKKNYDIMMRFETRQISR